MGLVLFLVVALLYGELDPEAEDGAAEPVEVEARREAVKNEQKDYFGILFRLKFEKLYKN